MTIWWIATAMPPARRFAGERHRIAMPTRPKALPLPLPPAPGGRLLRSRAATPPPEPAHGSAARAETGSSHAAARRNAPVARAWQRMLSGRRLDLLDPSPLDIELADIAHGLARVARWNGQTRGAHIFSVAQHTLLVEAVLRARAPRLAPRWRLAALLHDAPEYVIGDMISPFKAVIGDAYKAVEQRLLAAIHLRFGLPADLPAAVSAQIKAADRAAAYLEATRLAGFTAAEARRYFGRPPPQAARFEHDYLAPWPAETAARRYAERVARLAEAARS
jgi:5'-deoxynucleotidase YfbR-like HD superfamily hydrolase